MTPASSESPREGLWHKFLRHLPLDKDLLVKKGRDRSRYLNRQLAWPLAFVAGAVNAGGYMAIGIYTSHTTGSLSKAMDEAAVGRFGSALFYLGIIAAFMLGASAATFFIHFGHRSRFRSPYGGALFIEALLLLLFGSVAHYRSLSGTGQAGFIGACLAFFMGMLNAITTKISTSEVRVTHMTGNVTDIGIGLVELLYWNRIPDRKALRVVADRHRLRLHIGIVVSFLLGGITGALAFNHIGYEVVFAVASILLFLSVRPVLYDLSVRARLNRAKN